ncbi:MAG: DUF4112 domain-containing protein [Verrucomicrobiota bacterium]
MNNAVDSVERSKVIRIEYEAPPRLRRIRFLSRLLDQSIVLPFGYRIGLDPLLGLIPWIGDLIGTALSLYLIYEAARLGVPLRIIPPMLGNVLIDALGGAIPVLGDILDAVWKANMRNLTLIECHYPPAAPERSRRKVLFSLGLVLGLIFLGMVGVTVLAVRAVASFF